MTGTLRLTSPAPAGGAVVRLQGSMEGQVIVPQSVTIPAGSISATFTTHARAARLRFRAGYSFKVRYGTFGGSQARILEIDPAPGPATLLAIGPASQDVIGGHSGRASVALVIPAPAGGGVVSLTTDNPSVIHVPASVTIPAGNSATSFAIGTSTVTGLPTGGNVFATAGGVTKSIFVNVSADPNAPPLLQSMTISPTSVRGGTNATGTVFLSAPAPAGGIFVTLATSNSSVAQVPGIVNVPGGQTSASFTVTTFAVGNNTSVTITAFFDTTTSANLTVTAGAPSPTYAIANASPRFLHLALAQRPTRASHPGQTSHSTGAMSPEPSVTRSRSTIKTLFFADCESNGNRFSIQHQHPANTSGCGGASALMAPAGPGQWSAVRRFEVRN